MQAAKLQRGRYASKKYHISLSALLKLSKQHELCVNLWAIFKHSLLKRKEICYLTVLLADRMLSKYSSAISLGIAYSSGATIFKNS